MNVSFRQAAWEHYPYWQAAEPALVKKINRLIGECLRHPFEGTGKPEPLKGDFAGWWSRRIDQEHRLVYRVEGETLIVAQCRFHYHP